MKAHTGMSATDIVESFSRSAATGAAERFRDTRDARDGGDGSCRASVASGDSSRSEAKTAVGATSTASARSHQLRSSAGSLTASVLTPPG